MVSGARQDIDIGSGGVRRGLTPVGHRAGWILGGLALQLAGVGGPLAYVVTKAKHESVGGLLSVATVRLAWHGSLHTKAGVAVLAGGAALFAVGSVLLARPYVKSRLTLLLAVPLAALGGVLMLGVVAVVVALAFAGFESGGGGNGGLSDVPSFGGSGKRKSALADEGGDAAPDGGAVP
ncbi:MAG: hypothetical protein ACRDVE_21060 [Actinocrinis sp.]